MKKILTRVLLAAWNRLTIHLLLLAIMTQASQFVRPPELSD